MPSPLDHHLGYWLRYVSNHVSTSFAQKLATRDVTPAEWVLLRDLYDAQSLAPSTLADHLGLTRGAISKLADRLQSKDLITRTASPDDGRAHSLALTPKARALVPDLADLADQNDAEFFAHLSPDDRDRITNVMKDIVRRLGLRTLPTE